MYYIVFGLLYAISLIPLRILYIFSDGLFILLYHIIGYRKAVVRENLLTAFPEMSDSGRKAIEKQFYRNFIDNFIETLKLLSGGVAFANKHFKMDGSILEDQYRKGNRLQVHLGHNFNWELANAATSSNTSYPPLVVYMPIRNRIFDRIMLRLRKTGGNIMLPATDMKNAIFPYRNTRYLLVLVADQVPGDASKAYWLNFFGKPTPFMRGPERGAVAGNLSVAFASITKTRRGYYQLDLELITEDPASLPAGELTRLYVRYIEKVIRRHPEMWLWSHRRWKKEWEEAYRELWIDDTPAPGSPS